MVWRGHLYVDLALPFGLRSAPSIFTRFVDVLQEVLIKEGGVQNIQHYLDDFLILAALGSNQCQQDLHQSLYLCQSLGVPIADAK